MQQVTPGMTPDNPAQPPETAPILLITRPREQGARFAEACAVRLGPVETILAPVLDIVPRSGGIALDGVRGLIFTSENGVRAFVAACGRRDLPAWCVGARTAALARASGMAARAAVGDAASLVALLRAEAPPTPLLHLRGAHAAADIAAQLAAAGLPTRALIVYDQLARPLTAPARAALAGACPVITPVFSPRSAALLADAAAAATAPLHPVAISPAAAREWRARRPQDPIRVADRPDADAMRDAVTDLHGAITAP